VEVDKRQGSVESQQNRKSVDREHGRGSTDREYNNSRESLESRGWDSRELATVVAGQEAVLARLEMKLERIIGQANTLMISDAAQSSRLDRQEAEHKELLGKVEGLEAADVYLQESHRQLCERVERSERRSWSSAPGSSSQGNTLDRKSKRKEDRVGELIKELYTEDNTNEVLELNNKENVVPEKKESTSSRHDKREKALESRLERLEQLVGEGWSSSTRELVRREEMVTKEARETHQATYILKPQNGEFTPGEEVGAEVAHLHGLLELLLVQETAVTKRLLQLEHQLAEVKMRERREDPSQHYLGFMELVVSLHGCLADVTMDYVTQQDELKTLRKEQKRTKKTLEEQKKDLDNHLLSLERSYATVTEKQSSDLATLGRRTAAIETLVSQLREAAETTNVQQDAGKGGERRPGWLGRLLRNPCCCRC